MALRRLYEMATFLSLLIGNNQELQHLVTAGHHDHLCWGSLSLS